MHIYTVCGKTHDMIGNVFYLGYTFSIPNQPMSFKKIQFDDLNQLQSYVETDKSHWMKIWIEHIIITAKTITINKNPEFVRSMELCENFFQTIVNGDVPLKELCTRFIRGQKHFFKIIEGVKDHSMMGCVNGLLKFSQNELN